jgi:hypothetical protein
MTKKLQEKSKVSFCWLTYRLHDIPLAVKTFFDINSKPFLEFLHYTQVCKTYVYVDQIK